MHYGVGYLFGVYTNLEAFRQAYANDPSAFIIIARLATVALDVGTIIVVYYLARMFTDARAALLAGILAAINVLLVKESHLINVDTPLTFFSMLSFYFICKTYFNPATKWYLLAGVSIGLATATKYNGVFLVVVLILVHVLRTDSLKRALRSFLQPRLYLALMTASIMFVLFNPYIFFTWGEFIADVQQVKWHMELGHLGLEESESTFEDYFLRTFPSNLGLLLLLVSIGSMMYLLILRKKSFYVLLTFPIVFLVMVVLQKMRADRYILPVVPTLLIMGTIGIVRIWDSVRSFANKKLPALIRSTVIRVAVPALAAAVIAYPSLSAVLMYHASHRLPDTRTIVREWLVQNMPLGSAIASGPFGIEIPTSHFLTVPIPFNAGETEKTIPFYHPQWYEDLDLVIASDYDYGRYMQEPERLRRILDFYDTLRNRWKLVLEVKPLQNQNGPTFWLYRPPLSSARTHIDPQLLLNTLETADSAVVLNFLGKLGLVLSMKGRTEKSEQLLRLVTRIDPQNAVAWKKIIEMEFHQKRKSEVLRDIDIYFQRYPPDPDLLAMRGSILLQDGQLNRAEADLTKAMEMNPKIELAYVDLCLLYAMRNDRDKLATMLRKYLAILPPQSEQAQLVQQQLQQLDNR